VNSFPLLICVDFAQSEGHFAKQFDTDGNPSSALFQMQQDRLQTGGPARIDGVALIRVKQK